MSHKEWMKLTDGGITSRRSDRLKAIDAALLKYERSKSPADKQSVLAALKAWMTSKGNAWKSSIRNRHNAVESLYRQLNDLGSAQRNPVALSHVRNEARAIITDLFSGKQLVFRPGLATRMAGNGTFAKMGVRWMPFSILHNVNTVSGDALSRGAQQAAASVPGSASLASSLFSMSVPAEIAGTVKEALANTMPGFMAELQASCLPFVGIAVTGALTVKKGYDVAQSQYRRAQGTIHVARTLSTEEPEAAMQAIVRMLSREANDKAMDFARGLSEFGGKLTALLLDGGTVSNAAIGLSSSLVKLLLLLRIIVRDVQERKAANLLMLKPTITVELFGACPLMGAYLVCCAPTSVIVNTIFTADKFYQPGMMDLVERAVKKHIEPMKDQARRLIKEHRMYIPALQGYPGVLTPNMKELNAMREKVGKTGMKGFGSADLANA